MKLSGIFTNCKSLTFADKSTCAGFTLLEVMVAVAIIALSFTSLLGSQSQSISYAATARFETVASLLARQKLSQIYIEGFDGLFAGDGDFEDGFADYHWQTDVEDLTEDDTGLPGVDDMLKLVTLTVSRGDDEAMVFQVRAVVMNKIEKE
jgi:general secretion pathway protein I